MYSPGLPALDDNDQPVVLVGRSPEMDENSYFLMSHRHFQHAIQDRLDGFDRVIEVVAVD